MPPSRGHGATNNTLARNVEDILQLGVNGHGKPKKARKIVDAMFAAIIKGVKRDGFVTIEGFGRFYLHTRPERLIANVAVFDPDGKAKIIGRYTKRCPEQRLLCFSPSMPLLRFMQLGETDGC